MLEITAVLLTLTFLYICCGIAVSLAISTVETVTLIFTNERKEFKLKPFNLFIVATWPLLIVATTTGIICAVTTFILVLILCTFEKDKRSRSIIEHMKTINLEEL